MINTLLGSCQGGPETLGSLRQRQQPTLILLPLDPVPAVTLL